MQLRVVSQNGMDFSMLSILKMLSIFWVVEALADLIYNHSMSKDSSFWSYSLPGDRRSISYNVAKISKLIQDKTKLFFQNILQHDLY